MAIRLDVPGHPHRASRDVPEYEPYDHLSREEIVLERFWGRNRGRRQHETPSSFDRIFMVTFEWADDRSYCTVGHRYRMIRAGLI